MDSIAFANWLVVIRRLNASQRGRALHELALAEANLADVSADGAPGATAASGDRTGATIDAVLPRLDAASITAALDRVIAQSAELCCDGGSAIKAFARRSKVKFHVLPAPGIPLPEAPDLHINTFLESAVVSIDVGCGASMASPPRTSRAT